MSDNSDIEEPNNHYSEVNKWGTDLIGDENDRRKYILLNKSLLSMNEVEREEILAERAEQRQRWMEDEEIKRKLNKTHSLFFFIYMI